MARLTVGDPVRVVSDEEYRGQAGFVEEVTGMLVMVKLHYGHLTVFHKDQVIPIREAKKRGEG